MKCMVLSANDSAVQLEGFVMLNCSYANADQHMIVTCLQLQKVKASKDVRSEFPGLQKR